MSIVSSRFFQNITRSEAENYVMNNDKIVLRRSYSVQNCFVLTFKHNDYAAHILLRENYGNTIDHILSDNSNTIYRTYIGLNDLITNYKNRLPL